MSNIRNINSSDNTTTSSQLNNQSSSDNSNNLESNINEMSQRIGNINITNQGTGAGGANTNASGLPFEISTDLSTEFDNDKTVYHQYHKQVTFKNTTRNLMSSNQSAFFKYMSSKMNNTISHAHGCKKPDECYVDEEYKNIFIIEKKIKMVQVQYVKKYKPLILRNVNTVDYFHNIILFIFTVYQTGLKLVVWLKLNT